MNSRPEKVHTVTGYYDGPRSGIADYHGKPHVYESLWADSSGVWTDTFLLMSIDEETLQPALEAWAIWQRWEQAFHSGLTPQETHPALPEDRERYQELDLILKNRLEIAPERSVMVEGRFEIVPPTKPATTNPRQWLVFWSPTELPPEKFTLFTQM